jgi:hypothetical protein
VPLNRENMADHLSILTNKSFYINTIKTYTIDPASYKHYLHKDLLQLTIQLLKAIDNKQLRTHVGKFKSHTEITYNDEADTTARAVVDG